MKAKSQQIRGEALISVSDWIDSKNAGEYVKKRLGIFNEKSKKTNAQEIIDNGIEWAKKEMEPKWSKFLFSVVESGETKELVPQNNFFIGAADMTNESLKRLIDVTPKPKTKNKIEELI